MRLSDIIKVHKALALATTASNSFEAAAAGAAVRRLVKACNLDPTRIPDLSYVAHLDFTDNAVLKELRDEWREEHPVAAVVAKETRIFELDDCPTIPFNMNGFSKHANSKKKWKKRKRKIDLTYDQIEKVRGLLNEGLSMKEIDKHMSFGNGTANSIYQWRKNKIWIKDSNGQIQWVNPPPDLKPLTPQPDQPQSHESSTP